MHINVLLQLIAASGLAVMPTFAAPALEPAALAKRTTYSGVSELDTRPKTLRIV